MANWLDKLKDAKQRPKKALVVAAILIFLGFFLWGRVADAAEPEIGLGIGFGYASNSGATYQEVMLRDAQRRWYGTVARIGGDTRNNYHYWRFTAGYQVNWRKQTNFSPYARIGVAYFDQAPTDYISDTLAYELAIGVRLWEVIELDLDTHNSTGGRSDQNEGLDGWMFRLVFPF